MFPMERGEQLQDMPLTMVPFATFSFLLLWPTGYIVAVLALSDSGPYTFLALRYALAAVAMGALALALRARWPTRWTDYGHCAVVGVLIHGMGLGGVWVAINQGLEAGISALVMALQPVLTALLAMVWLGERPDWRTSAGLVLGLLGVIVVVQSKLSGEFGDPVGMAINGVSVVALTCGTLYQKRFCPSLDLMSGNAAQLFAASVFVGALMILFETEPFRWTTAVVTALGWAVLVLSIGATLALYFLLRRGAAARVASLFYLVPPLTAIMAWVGFGEALTAPALIGMAITTAGVALVVAPRASE
jgi:drug/metabolite transporter (DMT)-like permease